MTPQEKAISLVDSYRLILIKSDTDAGEEILCTLLAKECALVAVDEVLNVLPQSEYLEDRDEYYENRERLFWKQVEQEIQKL
jgi:hypothetical protein